MLYEFVYLTRPELSATQLDELNEKIKTILSKFDGNVGKIEYWGLRNLAYKIHKNKKAHYYLLNITTNPDGLNELKRLLSVNDNVLRTLAVKVEEHDESLSPLDKKASENKVYKNNETEEKLV